MQDSLKLYSIKFQHHLTMTPQVGRDPRGILVATKDINCTFLCKGLETIRRQFIKEKTVSIRVVRLNCIGLPRSGKTSFMRRIMSGILNFLMFATIHQANQAKESEGFLARGEKEQPGTGVGVAETRGSSMVWSNMVVQMLDQFAAAVVYPEHVLSFFTALTGSSPFEGSIEVAMFAASNQATEFENWDEPFLQPFDDKVLLINTDIGDQAELLDLHASLIQGPSFNLLFSRLVDELESQFVVYKDDACSRSINTIEQVLFQYLSSIAFYSGTVTRPLALSGEASVKKKCTEREAPKHPESKVMFVGTFRDQVTTEEFEREDKLLETKIKDSPFFQKGIIEFASEDQLMLPVDNMSRVQDEMERIQKILGRVIEQQSFQIILPASWLELSQKVRSTKLHTMTLNECEKLALKVGITSSELQRALRFLHHVGVLLYYPELEALRDTVICDIQVLFDSANNLIKNTFTSDKVGQKVKERFSERAQFSLSDVKKATSGHTDILIPLEKLVQLLEYLGFLTIIPPTPSSGGTSPQEPTYFMPCVLESARPDELEIHRCSDSDTVPLMLCLDRGYTPISLFHSMITTLVSQKLGGWKMIEEDIRKNRVQFQVGEDYDTVTLISRPRYFEFAISRSKGFWTSGFRTPTQSMCTHVREILGEVIRSTLTSHRKYRHCLGYKFGFECPAHPGREHLCVLPHEKAGHMECPDTQKTYPLQAPQQVWFSSTGPES